MDGVHFAWTWGCFPSLAGELPNWPVLLVNKTPKFPNMRGNDSAIDGSGSSRPLSNRGTGRDFETQPTMPKMPAGDHLPNHGITACPNWLETKNPRMWHKILRMDKKKFGGCVKISGMPKNFRGTRKCFRGWLKNNWGAKKKSGQWTKYIRALHYF